MRGADRPRFLRNARRKKTELERGQAETRGSSYVLLIATHRGITRRALISRARRMLLLNPAAVRWVFESLLSSKLKSISITQ